MINSRIDVDIATGAAPGYEDANVGDCCAGDVEIGVRARKEFPGPAETSPRAYGAEGISVVEGAVDAAAAFCEFPAGGDGGSVLES